MHMPHYGAILRILIKVFLRIIGIRRNEAHRIQVAAPDSRPAAPDPIFLEIDHIFAVTMSFGKAIRAPDYVSRFQIRVS